MPSIHACIALITYMSYQSMPLMHGMTCMACMVITQMDDMCHPWLDMQGMHAACHFQQRWPDHQTARGSLTTKKKQVGTLVAMPKGDGRFVVDVASVSACSQSEGSQTPTACSLQRISVKADNLKLGVKPRNAVENNTGFVRTLWNADEKSSFVQRTHCLVHSK